MRLLSALLLPSLAALSLGFRRTQNGGNNAPCCSLRLKRSDGGPEELLLVAASPVPAKKADTSTPAPPPVPVGASPSSSQVWSAVALITGTTVGAGILALPAVTASAGFVPSTVALLGSWVFMASSALLFAEVAANLVREDGGSRGLGVLAMVSRLLPRAALPAGVLYALIHYALLTAYIAGGGEILSRAASLSPLAGPVIFASSLGGLLTFGTARQVEAVNNVFVACVAVGFAALVSIVAPLAKADRLVSGDWSSVVGAVPVMLVALVFHNVVPAVCQQLNYNRRAVTTAVLGGSAIPLLMFVLWNGLILASVEGGAGSGGVDPLQMLRTQPGASAWVDLFSASAIVTSFFGFVIGLISFFKDAAPSYASASLTPDGRGSKSSSSSKEKQGSAGLAKAEAAAISEGAATPPLYFLLALAPPAAIAVLQPSIFLSALEFAGAYGITLLFGLLPVVMAGLLRRRGGGGYETYLPGGAGVLGAMGACVGLVLGSKVWEAAQ